IDPNTLALYLTLNFTNQIIYNRPTLSTPSAIYSVVRDGVLYWSNESESGDTEAILSYSGPHYDQVGIVITPAPAGSNNLRPFNLPCVTVKDSATDGNWLVLERPSFSSNYTWQVPQICRITSDGQVKTLVKDGNYYGINFWSIVFNGHYILCDTANYVAYSVPMDSEEPVTPTKIDFFSTLPTYAMWGLTVAELPEPTLVVFVSADGPNGGLLYYTSTDAVT